MNRTVVPAVANDIQTVLLNSEDRPADVVLSSLVAIIRFGGSELPGEERAVALLFKEAMVLATAGDSNT